MGSVSAPFTAFMDKSSKTWGGRKGKDNVAAGFTNSASQSSDKLNTLIQLPVFAAQHGMHWINVGLMPGNNSSQGSPKDLNRLGSYLGAMTQSNSDAAACNSCRPASVSCARWPRRSNKSTSRSSSSFYTA